MTIEPTSWLVIGLGISTIVSTALAVTALIIGHNARRRLEAFAEAVAQLEHAMQSAATIFAESDLRMSAACEQIDKLTMRQGTLDAAGTQAGFQQAIALTRRGASMDEVMNVCGVSLGEARLIQTMYGQVGSSNQSAAAN